MIFCLFPFYWLVNISLKTGADLSSVDLIPPNPTLDNYKSIFQNDDFTRALANSAIVASRRRSWASWWARSARTRWRA